jgi:hypothetical protein
VLGAVNGINHSGHIPKANKKALLGKSASPFGRVEPTFAAPPSNDTLHVNPPPKKEEPKPTPVPPPIPAAKKVEPALDDDLRVKQAMKIHGAYQKAIESAARTHDEGRRASYMKMAVAHAQTLKKHKVNVDIDSDMKALQKVPTPKSPGRKPPPVSA